MDNSSVRTMTAKIGGKSVVVTVAPGVLPKTGFEYEPGVVMFGGLRVGEVWPTKQFRPKIKYTGSFVLNENYVLGSNYFDTEEEAVEWVVDRAVRYFDLLFVDPFEDTSPVDD